MLPEELTAFALINFEMYMGNGFGRRMDFNYPNGIEEFFNARQAAEEMALVQTLALFTEVNDVLIKMGITRALCEELDIFCFFGLEDIVDASGLRKDFFPDSGSKCSLYDVFKKLSAPFHFDSRWAELGQSEMQPALIKFLHQNRDKLCCRKQKS